jgi:hypothetical protein
VRNEVVMDFGAFKDPSSERMRSGDRVIYLLNRSIGLLTDWMKSYGNVRCELDLLNSMEGSGDRHMDVKRSLGYINY